MDNSNHQWKNEAKQQSEITTLEKKSDSALTLAEQSKTYEELVFLILSDAYAMSSFIYTIEEIIAKSKDVSRILQPIIPENKLQECFEIAQSRHKSPYAVSGNDLVLAWNDIKPPPPRKTARDYIAEIEHQHQH